MQHVRVDSERKMPIQAHMLPAFLAILAVITAGTLRMSWWAVVAGGCALALISLSSAHGSFARYGPAGSSIGLAAVLLSTTLNAGVSATAAFVLGRFLGWCWGL
jgi:hypothetical protein